MKTTCHCDSRNHIFNISGQKFTLLCTHTLMKPLSKPATRHTGPWAPPPTKHDERAADWARLIGASATILLSKNSTNFVPWLRMRQSISSWKMSCVFNSQMTGGFWRGREKAMVTKGLRQRTAPKDHCSRQPIRSSESKSLSPPCHASVREHALSFIECHNEIRYHCPTLACTASRPHLQFPAAKNVPSALTHEQRRPLPSSNTGFFIAMMPWFDCDAGPRLTLPANRQAGEALSHPFNSDTQDQPANPHWVAGRTRVETSCMRNTDSSSEHDRAHSTTKTCHFYAPFPQSIRRRTTRQGPRIQCPSPVYASQTQHNGSNPSECIFCCTTPCHPRRQDSSAVAAAYVSR